MKKKIIRVIARLNIGGPAIHVILLSSMLNPERYETHLISGQETADEGNMLHLAEEKNVSPSIIPRLGRKLNPIGDLSTLWRLIRLFRRERPDIVHTHTAKAGTIGRIAAILARVPIIIHTFHGHVLHGYFGSLETIIYCMIERILAYFSKSIITVSEQCRTDILNLGIGSPDKVQTIPLGLELDRFAEPIPNARQELRDKYNIPQDAFVTGMIARMVPIKRHQDLFNAIPIVLQSHPDAYFLIVGDGECRANLDALAEELNITHRCIFAGFHHDLDRIYKAVDLVVLTSANEGLPVAIIESLSSGISVVSTRVGGVPELIDDGKTGYIVEPGDIDSIADGLIKAIADPEKTRSMGKIAQKETIEKYSIRRLVKDIEELYEHLSSKH